MTLEQLRQAGLKLALEYVNVALYRTSRGLDCEADLHKAQRVLKELLEEYSKET
jgi:CMP-2-keto-3-deoxyoctulosonic acid synthetase